MGGSNVERVLIEAAVEASTFLEVRDPAVLKAVGDIVSPTALGLARVVAKQDPAFASRWKVAGADWMAQAHILHEALLFVLTPDGQRGDA